jgi:homoserine dehydrogenase
MAKKQVRIALLGFGTVGSGIYRIVTGMRDEIARREDVELSAARVLVKALDEPNTKIAEDQSIFTTNFEDVLADEEVSVIAECMGGEEPARTFIMAALNAGKTVVTSNKEVFAKHWKQMEEAAHASGAGLYFEATVGGGIPVIRTLTHSMQGNNVESIMGIINGTTNYILTAMSEEGREFADVLREAQAKGYAEFDPTADVEGFDAMYKISILASLAFNTRVPIERVYREGISKVTKQDIGYAREFGCAIKLLAIAKMKEGRIEVRVHPTMVPLEHPLAAVRGSFNAVFIHGNNVDDVMLYGRGAGSLPTASAMVSDIIIACSGHEHRYPLLDANGDGNTFEDDWESEFYVHMKVLDKPGVLARIAGVFGKHQVSLASVIQKEPDSNDTAHLVFITHKSREKAFGAAIEEIEGLPEVSAVLGRLRVEH